MNPEARLSELAALKPGWFAGAGAAISAQTIATARAVLVELAACGVPTPGVYPTPRGGVQCEWLDRDRVAGEVEALEGRVEAWVHLEPVEFGKPDETWEMAGEDVAAIVREFAVVAGWPR